jgi:hypothetical protein
MHNKVGEEPHRVDWYIKHCPTILCSLPGASWHGLFGLFRVITYITMTSESSHSHGGAGESHTTLETIRSFPQNTPSAHLNDVTRSITPSLALSPTGQRARANQQDGAAPERPSRPTNLLRELSLRSFPPDDTDANIGRLSAMTVPSSIPNSTILESMTHQHAERLSTSKFDHPPLLEAYNQ